jgi:hypothetical protein
MAATRQIATTTVIVAGALAASYLAAGGVPTMDQPVRVSEATYLADGSSFHLVFLDSQGRRFAVEASGSLNLQPAQFPLYTQRWWPYFPLPFYVFKGSETERQLLKSVGSWHAQQGLSEQERVALGQAVAFLRNRTSSGTRQ